LTPLLIYLYKKRILFQQLFWRKTLLFIQRMCKKTKLDMKKNIIATALVFSIFIKGEIYHQIVIEKLKEAIKAVNFSDYQSLFGIL